MNLLIPYVYDSDHEDPALREFTYGDVKARGRKLQNAVKKDDVLFFHTSVAGQKCITAYYVVERVLPTAAACAEPTIRDKYKSPHILRWNAPGQTLYKDDVIVFGNPITSRVLDKPLPLDKSLASKLSLNIRFPSNRTEAQAIGSATRPWRELTVRDKDILLSAVAHGKSNGIASPSLRSIEEVAQVIEVDIEDYIARNPHLIGPGLRLKERQHNCAGRADLIFEDKEQNLTVVELKLNRIGREAIQQVRRYARELQKHTSKKVEAMVVCAGLMPAYEEELRKQKKVRILIHGWELKVRPV